MQETFRGEESKAEDKGQPSKGAQITSWTEERKRQGVCAPAGEGQNVPELCMGSGCSQHSIILSAPHWIVGMTATARQQEAVRSCPESRPS